MDSPSETEDPWDAYNKDDDDETQKDIPKYTGNELAILSPNETVSYDMRNENAINNETYKLAKSLGFYEEIIAAAHKVSQYVPDLSNDKHSKFWKQDVSVITRAEQNLSPIIDYIKSSSNNCYLSLAGHS